jgi:uncharacterized protein (DUF169 family)
MENYEGIANFIRDELRLRGFPIAVKYLKGRDDFPEKTRQPSIDLKKRITICQAVTMARIYGWTAYSARFRPPIPGEAGHPFRLIPATDSGGSRPPL